jgi:hypothetical protein
MANELHVPVGTVPGYGADIEVCRHPDGSAAIWMGFTGASVSVPPESVAALAELIQRAAMPGQPPADTALDPATRPAADDEIVSPSCNYEVVDDVSGRMVDVGADLGRVEIAGHKVTVAAARELHAGLAASIRHCEWWLAENAPDEPLTVAAVSEDAMEALGQLADAAQQEDEHG